MYSGAIRLISIFVLALSLCILSGAVTSVLAVVENCTHTDACCPDKPAEGEAGEAHCASPECQCLSCLTVELQHRSDTFIGGVDAKSAYHDAILPLTSADYRTIDYPPEVA